MKLQIWNYNKNDWVIIKNQRLIVDIELLLKGLVDFYNYNNL